MCKSNQSTGRTEPCYRKRGISQHVMAPRVLVLLNLCTRNMTGRTTYCLHLYTLCKHTHCCRKNKAKSTLFTLVLASTHTHHLHAGLHAARLDHTYMMRTQTSVHPRARTHADTRQVHTYHAPASQSAPWYPPELRAKIRTRELKIHYGGGGR